VKSKRRRKVIVETREVVILHQAETRPALWCQSCRVMAPMVSPEDAVRLAAVTSRTIYRWVEDEKIHYSETPDGRLWICVESLIEKTRARGGLNGYTTSGQPHKEGK
jgi:hypothetical protein